MPPHAAPPYDAPPPTPERYRYACATLGGSFAQLVMWSGLSLGTLILTVWFLGGSAKGTSSSTPNCDAFVYNMLLALLIPIVLCILVLAHFGRNQYELDVATQFPVAGEVQSMPDAKVLIAAVIVATLATLWLCVDVFSDGRNVSALNSGDAFTMILLYGLLFVLIPNTSQCWRNSEYAERWKTRPSTHAHFQRVIELLVGSGGMAFHRYASVAFLAYALVVYLKDHTTTERDTKLVMMVMLALATCVASFVIRNRFEATQKRNHLNDVAEMDTLQIYVIGIAIVLVPLGYLGRMGYVQGGQDGFHLLVVAVTVLATALAFCVATRNAAVAVQLREGNGADAPRLPHQ